MDFDFEEGKRHYRGRGARGLLALAMILAIRALLIGGGATAAYQIAPPLFRMLRGYFGE
jgi:hypothetical protein